MSKFSFAGKRILVTGGANGLGRALLKKFYESNALVYTVDKDEAGLETVKNEFPNVTVATVDLNDWNRTKEVIESFCTMDYLVNNAGMALVENFFDISKESLEKQMNVNFASMINVTQVVAKKMMEANIQGSVVNVSSVLADAVIDASCVYSCTKAAVKILTKCCALELAPHNIRVNCIIPGPMDTDMLKLIKNDESKYKTVLAKMLIKRPAETSEVADLVVFILSPLASMITGESIVIDGGYSIG